MNISRRIDTRIFPVARSEMPELMAAMLPFVKHYQSDLFIDFAEMLEMPLMNDQSDNPRESRPFVWAIRETGTHFLPIHQYETIYKIGTAKRVYHVFRIAPDKWQFRRIGEISE